MGSTQTLGDLQSRFSVPGILDFEEGPGGFVRASIKAAAARGVVYLHGAHVAEYQPVGQEPVLFMSQQSVYAPGKAIRGGVPVIFPWFGPRQADPSAPLHGLVRTREWTVESTACEDGVVRLHLSLADDEQTRAAWDHPFQLRLEVAVGPTLQIAMEVRNPSDKPMTFEQALHTYLAVGDVRRVSIRGLERAKYLDRMDGGKRKQQGAEPVRITGETDRVYLNHQATCVIEDPSLDRTIAVEKSGSHTTVVWNPWIDKAKAMPDFGDDEWPGMLCVETANAMENAVRVAGGAKHRMEATVHLI